MKALCGHTRAGCCGSEPVAGGSYCFQAAAGRGPESKPEARRPPGPGARLPASTCAGCPGVPTMWQPALPEDPHTSQDLKE